MIWLLVLFVGSLIVWRLRRRARATELAGRLSVAPVYSVEPPARRVGKRSREAL